MPKQLFYVRPGSVEALEFSVFIAHYNPDFIRAIATHLTGMTDEVLQSLYRHHYT